MKSNPRGPSSFVTLLVLASCGGGETGGRPSPPATSPGAGAGRAAPQFVLAQDPGPAQEVKAAKAAGPSESTVVVVVGRVGHIVPGRAVFTLMDASLPFCGQENEEDGCKTPWDYCCESPETRTANALVVEVRDAAGEPKKTPTLPELRLLDLVAVTGRLSQDEHGNFVLVATGWYRRERPDLPADVRWPG